MNTSVRTPREAFAPVPGFEPTPGWRRLDAAVAYWVLAHGGSPLLATVAGCASQADGRGDSALWLDTPALLAALPGHDAASLAAALAAEPLVVRDEDAATRPHAPFVLAGDAVQLRRHQAAECAIVVAMAQRLSPPQATQATTTPAGFAIAELFDHPADDRDAAQRHAVQAVLDASLCVLTGGPGTGKTTTVQKMLLALARAHHARTGQPARIRLAAPTGKAAQRLREAVRLGQARAAALPDAWADARASVQAASADTVHRLLGAQGEGRGYRRHAANPLPADIVVVDECSMLDLHLLRALLDAVPADATLVLVGDADQLTSVGTGSVLLDVVAALAARDDPRLQRLRHGFRSDAVLAPLLDAVRDGASMRFDAAWLAAEAAGLAMQRETRTRAARARNLRDWIHALIAEGEAAGVTDVVECDDPTHAHALLQLLRARQLLCAHRHGDDGAEAADHAIEARLRQHFGVAAGDDWYPGRRVMVTRNDPALGLFNGDTGLCLRTRLADGRVRLRVWFEGAAGVNAMATASTNADQATAVAPCRAFLPEELGEVTGAFAVTVHKSQGSEFDHVALWLPGDADSPLLTRQMLYTGLSRARRAVEVWGGRDAVHRAIATPIRRRSGLGQRLATVWTRDAATT